MGRQKRWLSAAMLGMTAAVVAVVLAACGNSSASSAGNASSTTWTTMAGDVIPSMDPSKSTDIISGQALQNTMEGLYVYKGNKLSPAMAKAVVKPTNNGLTYTYTLRDAKWSNGDDVTAADFVYGWRRSVDPATKSEYAYLLSGVQNADDIIAGKKDPSTLGVAATGKHTFTVTLDRAIPYFNTMMSSAVFYPQNEAFVKKEGKRFGTTATATLANGPYKLSGWDGTNNSWTFTKNKAYWNAKAVQITTLNTKVVKDSNAALNLYNSGKLDDATLTGQQAASAKTNKDYKGRKEMSTFYMEMNQEKIPAFKNAKVRQAFSMAINRSEFIKQVMKDGSIPSTGLTPQGLMTDPEDTESDFNQAAAKGVSQYTSYNLAEAKRLATEGMKEAGVSSLNLTLLGDDTSASKLVAEYLQSAFEKLPNVKVTIQSVPFKTRLSKSNNGDFDLVVSGWAADFPDAISFLDLFTTGTSYNRGKWSNADYDKLIEASKTTDANDAEARYNDLLQAQQLLTREAGVIPIYQRVASHLTNPAGQNILYGPNGLYNYVGASLE